MRNHAYSYLQVSNQGMNFWFNHESNIENDQAFHSKSTTRDFSKRATIRVRDDSQWKVLVAKYGLPPVFFLLLIS